MARANTVIEIKVDQKKQAHRKQILSQAQEVRQDEAAVSGLLDKVSVAIEKLPEFDEVEQLSETLNAARERLNIAITHTKGLNDLKEELAFARAQLRTSRADLSRLLVGYTALYKERSLMLEHEHKQIDITAKIGKTIDRQEVLPL